MRSVKILFGFMSAALVAGPAILPLSAEASGVGAKRNVAVFALGYGGRDIPIETLGGVDEAIRKLFDDFGRFEVIGMRQRLSQKGVEELLDALLKNERDGAVDPEGYRFGKAEITAAEFSSLLEAFAMAIPVLSEFDSSFDETEGRWETDIKADVTLIGSGGAALGIARVESKGIDETDQESSISKAVEGIPMRLQYELRKIDAFRFSARILAVSGKDIELGLGRGAGVKNGDEYAVVAGGRAEDIENASELGLVVIGKAGPNASTGRVLYSRIDLGEESRLEEIPRLGVDLEPYLHFVAGRNLDLPADPKGAEGVNAVAGIRVPISRGFYGLRPYGAIQVPTSGVRAIAAAFVFPVDLLLGAEYRSYSGRISLTPYCGIGIGYVYVSETIYGESSDSSDTLIPHIGGHAYLNLAFLASRDIRIFAELGGEYWISTVTDLYTDYGGIGFGAGIAIKL